jgi:hypothetical protein
MIYFTFKYWEYSTLNSSYLSLLFLFISIALDILESKFPANSNLNLNKEKSTSFTSSLESLVKEKFVENIRLF